MRLLAIFLFALGVLTGTGGPILAPKPAATPAPAAPEQPTVCTRPAAAPPAKATCPRCTSIRPQAEPVAAPKLAAEIHPTPRPAGV
jgi:hypothetical protein